MREVITSAALALELSLSTVCLVIRFWTWKRVNEGASSVSFTSVPGTLTLLLTLESGIVHMWTFITTSWTECSLFSTATTVIVLYLGCQYFERIWGTRSLVKYLALLSIAPPLFNFVCYLLYFQFMDPSSAKGVSLLSRRINGGVPFHVGFAVAFKQAIPLHTVNIFRGTLKIPIKYIVMPVLVAYTIIGLAFDSTFLILSWTSLLLSWWYLRFVKSIVADNLALDGTSTVLKGDKSDSFAFAKFFYPLPITNAIANVSSKLYDLFVKIRVLRPFDEEQVASSNERARNDNDAERRRALALRELGSL
ncbi:hypothetical protein B9G98_04311 [Wickerhamiella sorbophila]|uniref:Transmembrane protein 115 n=1 Tax=Wickerhamiella sorbophila TaxID=45607 RepID=A0A2T0FNX3_9ASCO|nr:hypothetical protein B9G98_04311 [Wickerhamiella sorbophila]PRT56691.1 hypothetical protein B9G98_04311 [Wickerhamiella sorbophila]